MKQTVLIAFIATCIILSVALVKYYWFFLPRIYNITVTAYDMPVYAETWNVYSPNNNYIGLLPYHSIVISYKAGIFKKDIGFFRIQLSGGQSGYINHHGETITFHLVYLNKLSWYFHDQLLDITMDK